MTYIRTDRETDRMHSVAWWKSCVHAA